MREISFSRDVLIYVPCYNCSKYIERTINEIPKEFHDIAEVLMVNNCSTDQTPEVIKQILSKEYPFPVSAITTPKNLGYAGSQKLVYSMVQKLPNHFKKVIMLHGDGQYPPDAMKGFLPYIYEDVAIANAYRDKKVFPEIEETPFSTYWIIKILDKIENILTGIHRKEWHSGFVMYSADFLKKLSLQDLHTYRHIDGEMLIISHFMKERVEFVPIWKRYKEFEAFVGSERTEYIWHVFKIIWKSRTGYYKKFATLQPSSLPIEYDVM